MGKIRFCVGDNNKHSNVFDVIEQKNDIYIISSGKQNQMKLSIHESGAAHSAFTSEYVAKSGIVEKNQDRFLFRMNLLELSDRFEIVDSFLFPYSEIVLTDEVKKKVMWIDAPPKKKFLEIVFCKAGCLKRIQKTDYWVLYTSCLENGTFFSIMYRYVYPKETIINSNFAHRF